MHLRVNFVDFLGCASCQTLPSPVCSPSLADSLYISVPVPLPFSLPGLSTIQILSRCPLTWASLLLGPEWDSDAHADSSVEHSELKDRGWDG